MSALFADLKRQWQANRRLRVAAGIAALALIANLAGAVSGVRHQWASDFESDRPLLSRLEGAAADASWLQRADEAAAALVAVEGSMPEAAGEGQAQAELQALLASAAAVAGIADIAVRTDGAAAVEGLPEVWEVSARLAGNAGGAASTALLGELAGHPWVRVDRVEIHDGSPGQVQMIVRGYFRQVTPEVLP